jgi:hypothetical protein
MKICTACNSTYSDETLIFCPSDGTTLTPEKKISFDQVPFPYGSGNWSDAEEAASSGADSFSNPEPPVAATFPQPPWAPQNLTSAPNRNANRSSILPVAAGAVAVIAFAGLLAFIISGSSNYDEPEVRVRSANTVRLANGTSVRAEPENIVRTNANTAVAVNGPATTANAAPANNTAVAINVPVRSISRKTDFTGIWQGKFNEEPAVLSITTQKGDNFSGTLSKKGYIIVISGKIDFDKGTVSVMETEVLQTPPNLNWNLGTNDGKIFDGGKMMSGVGSDKKSSYSWSFTKK